MTPSTADQVLTMLARYALTAKQGGRYLSNSPLRPGSNSHALSPLINGPEHGAYVDFVSGEKGSLYDLAAKLGIATPKKTDTTNTFANYPGDGSAGSGWIRPSPVTAAMSRCNKPGSGFSGRSLISSSA